MLPLRRPGYKESSSLLPWSVVAEEYKFCQLWSLRRIFFADNAVGINFSETMTQYYDVQVNYFIDNDGNVIFTKLLVEYMIVAGMLPQLFKRTLAC